MKIKYYQEKNSNLIVLAWSFSNEVNLLKCTFIVSKQSLPKNITLMMVFFEEKINVPSGFVCYVFYNHRVWQFSLAFK